MASQIKRHFGSRVDVEITGLGDVEDWGRFELIISSMTVEGVAIPVIQVSTLVDEDDIKAIEIEIERRAVLNAQTPVQTGAKQLVEECERIGGILNDARAILVNFDVEFIEADCNFDQLVKIAGYRFGVFAESGRLIYEDLTKRERLSTQVIPSLGIVLLHARTSGVDSPVFSLIVPEHGWFSDPYLKNSRCCVIMLIPQESSRDRLCLMGRISSALIEDNNFLTSVLEGDKSSVYGIMEDYFRDYISSNISFR